MMKNRLEIFLLLLPALILLTLFTYYPVIKTIWQSFVIDVPGLPQEIGTSYYQDLLSDSSFKKALWNNLIYALITVPISICLAIVMALWVNQYIVGQSLARLVFFLPTMLPMIAVANIWLLFYQPQIGFFNHVLSFFGMQGINWLGDQKTALYSIMAIAIWKQAGFFMIFYLATLQNLPKELYNAAKVEGANAIQRFFKITWPLLMPTTLFVMINALLDAFKLVDHIFVLTSGGPDNATNLLLYYIYETAFSFSDMAYAATLTVVLLCILMCVSLFQFAVVGRRTHYR